MNKYERRRKGILKAKKAFANYYGDTDMTPENSKGHFGALKNTRKFCSNPLCCGNPRRIKGQNNYTIQELRAFNE